MFQHLPPKMLQEFSNRSDILKEHYGSHRFQNDNDVKTVKWLKSQYPKFYKMSIKKLLISRLDKCLNRHEHYIKKDTCHKTNITIMRKLNLIINVLTNPESNQVDVTKSDLLPDFQLSTTEEFLKFENELQTDREIRKQFKNRIAKIGGNLYAGRTRNILKFALLDTLCQKLSWTGRKGFLAIKETTFANIIIDYVSHVDNCTHHQVQKIIQEWLRHAGDRINYAKKK
ncbi:uncharacterized protein LOC105835708 [Monomorium pharaonis]|uniref:uncharacterized protein LOC105835708 n=1 Tax=Monomorium pharaonis TaxID=307658 RepID=UPI0017471428|nr:uncharacterized protein LOC105835708 [Monomorium pharaonis]